MINANTVRDAIGLDFDISGVTGVGDLYAVHAPSILSYIARAELVQALAENRNISHVFCTASLSVALPSGVTALVVEDPTWAFFSVVDFLAGRRRFDLSRIAESAQVDGSYISPNGVTIGHGVRLEPFCTVRESTTIGPNSTVRSGAAIGLDTFQHQRTRKGMISPRHDGSLVIGERVEIGANTSISRGFSYRDTIIGDEVKIDCNVSISHGVHIGRGSVICAGVLVLGHSVIGENVFVGPGAVLRNRIVVGDGARISIGSVVTRNVAAGKTVTGNFAVDHQAWMAFMKDLAGS